MSPQLKDLLAELSDILLELNKYMPYESVGSLSDALGMIVNAFKVPQEVLLNLVNYAYKVNKLKAEGVEVDLPPELFLSKPEPGKAN